MNPAPAPQNRETAALAMDDVGLVRSGRDVLRDVTWSVRPGERWIVLGPNGSGKTSLVRIAALYLHPTRGRVRVLGEELGATDVRALRTRIGYTSAALADLLRPTVTARDAVMTAVHAALEPWWHRYTPTERGRAEELLARVGCAGLGDRTFGTLSSRERQRVLLARALMGGPGLVLLDEPTAGLDLAGREQLVATLADLAADPATPPVVLVTHHVDEIPPGFTHALLLRDGRPMASGRLRETLTGTALGKLFGLELTLRRHDDGRWTARTASAPAN